ncbi:MAG TPA: hypothetical protein VF053_02535 [Streptosporangiales bacterium]
MNAGCPGPLPPTADGDSLLVECGSCSYVLVVRVSGVHDEAHRETPWAKPEPVGGAS